MDNFLNNKVEWIKISSISGLLGIVLYFLAAFAPLPDVVSYIAAFAFGPLLAVGCVGLYQCLSAHKKSPFLQIGLFCAISSGLLILLMLTVQQSIFEMINKANTIENLPDSIYNFLYYTINSVHWGIDVAFDIMLSVATIIFGICMLKHPRFGKIFGGLGVILGSLLLSFNIYFFPTPPESVNSIDWGPFTALWFTLAFILLFFSRRWIVKILNEK